MEIIKELQSGDILNNIKNKDFERYILTLINLEVWKKMDENAIGKVEMKQNGPNQIPFPKEWKVKDLIPIAEKQKANSEAVLDAIERVRLQLHNK